MRPLPARDVGKCWFVAQVQPNRERQAQAHLLQQGFEVFHPVIQRTIRHARQFRERECPLFPGYIFVSFDPEAAPWRRINGTRGVAALVTMAGEPAQVPDDVMDNLQIFYGQRHKAASLPFAVGDRVRLMGGPFANLVGTLSSLDGRGRIEVLLEILGMSVTVKTDLAHGVPLPVAS